MEPQIVAEQFRFTLSRVNTIKNHGRFGLGLLAGLGVALGLIGLTCNDPPIARADDKVFAPQSCRALDPQFGGVGAVGIRVAEIEQTAQVDGQTFICPLIRDEVTGTLDDLWVRLNNENKDEQTPPRCCVHSVSLGGSLYDFECQTSLDIDGPLSMRFILDDFTEFDHGHYVVTCELGIEDRLISIRTRETP